MKAEIITIGEEILSGQTTDTNAVFIARRLADAGVQVVWQTSVGDRTDDIASAIQTAWQRAAVVVATGGLGPTLDDITKKAICAAFDRKLVLHDEILVELQRRYEERGKKMPALVQNQALQPQGAELIPNRVGSASGIVIRDTTHYFVALPGVPVEMEHLMLSGVLPQLSTLPGRDHIEIRLIRTVGIMESEISERINDLQPAGSDLRLAYLPDYRGVDLRVTGVGPVAEQVHTAVERLTEAIVVRLRENVYTIGSESLMEIVSRSLIESKTTVATAESCTGGLLAKMMTDIPGSSDYYLGSIVAYANEVKRQVLKVPGRVLVQKGAVSREVAEAMAQGVRKLTGAKIGISTTGIAGPGGATEQKPVGLVYLGISTQSGTEVRELNLIGTRERIRERSCLIALDMLRRRLAGNA